MKAEIRMMREDELVGSRIVGRAVEVDQGGLLVVAVHQKQRRGGADQPQPLPLGAVALRHRRGRDTAQGVDAEVIADGQVEVRLVGRDIPQGARVEVGVESIGTPVAAACVAVRAV